MDPAIATPAADSASTNPAPGEVAVDPATNPAPAAPAGDAKVPAEGGQPAAPAAAAPADKSKPNITARLAALSGENRRVQVALRKAEEARQAAETRASEFETLAQRAQTGDVAAIRGLHEKFGLSFERVVDAYAQGGEPAELTPEQAIQKKLDDVQKRLDDNEKRLTDERNAAAERANDNARQEQLAGIVEKMKAMGDKAEVCTNLGVEAAEKVWKEIITAWDKMGRPQLMPGEYDEAIEAAIDLVEQQEIEAGKKRTKGARQASGANGAASGNGAPALAATNSDLPASLTASKPISDKDEDILSGLIDKTAPAYGSQRAKPRAISRELGGSAPPPAPPRGSMDARDALRETLAANGLVGR